MGKTSNRKGEKFSSGKKATYEEVKAAYIDAIKTALPDNPEIAKNADAIFEKLKNKSILSPNAKTKAKNAKTKSIGNAFIFEATQDSKICRILYSKKFYPQAIYHLQQAVEKTVKGFVLIEGYCEQEDVFTHDSPYVLIKALLEKNGISELLTSLGNTSFISTNERVLSAIRNVKERVKIAKTSSKGIEEHLASINSYMNQFNQIFDFLYDVLHDRDSNYDQTLASARMTPVVTLYVLSVITFPHESFTRYPGPEMSPSDYTKQLGIVKEALKIVKILECEQRKIKKL